MRNIKEELSKNEVLDLINKYCNMVKIEGDFSNLLTLDTYSYKGEDKFPELVEYMEVKELVDNVDSDDDLNLLLESKLISLLRKILRLELQNKLDLPSIEASSELDILYSVLGDNEFINRLYSSIPKELIIKELENYYSIGDSNLIEVIPFYPCELKCGMTNSQMEYFINKVYESLLLECAYDIKVLLVKYKDSIYSMLRDEVNNNCKTHVVNNLNEYIDYMTHEKLNYTLGLKDSLVIKNKDNIVKSLESMVSKGIESIYYDKLKEIK